MTYLATSSWLFGMKRNFPYIFFLILLFLVSTAFFGLIKDFLLAVFWSVVLAVLFHSWYRKILNRLNGKRNAAAALTLLAILLMVILPLFLIGYAVTVEAMTFYKNIQTGEINIQQWVDNIREQGPAVERFLERLSLDVNQFKTSLNESVANISKIIATKVFNFTQNFLGFLIQFSIMLYILYFFLRDGAQLIERLIWVLPIGDEKERTLLRRFESVSRATVKGSLVVAMTQGAAGGLLFFAVGIPGAVLWGVLMTLLSLLPLGSGVVWLPAAVILFAQGEVGKALIIVITGSLFIGLLDNVLRPRLVGSDTKMPDYLVLLSTLGGLTWFGISGFVLGPMIAAFFVTFWQMMGDDEASETG